MISMRRLGERSGRTRSASSSARSSAVSGGGMKRWLHRAGGPVTTLPAELAPIRLEAPRRAPELGCELPRIEVAVVGHVVLVDHTRDAVDVLRVVPAAEQL